LFPIIWYEAHEFMIHVRGEEDVQKLHVWARVAVEEEDDIWVTYSC